MSCSSRNNQRNRDINSVRALAKKAANVLGVDMKIYKTLCDGVTVFKFSNTWPGNFVEIVPFDRNDTSTDFLRNNEDKGLDAIKPVKHKVTKRDRAAGDME